MNVVNESAKPQDEQEPSQTRTQEQAGHVDQPEAQQTREAGGPAGQQQLQQQKQQAHQVPSHQTAYSGHGSYSAPPQHLQQPPMKPPAGEQRGKKTNAFSKYACMYAIFGIFLSLDNQDMMAQ